MKILLIKRNPIVRRHYDFLKFQIIFGDQTKHNLLVLNHAEGLSQLYSEVNT